MSPRNRRNRIKELKKKSHKLRSTLYLFSFYVIMGALAFSSAEPQIDILSASAMVITIHLSLIYAVRYNDLRALQFSQTGIFFILIMNIMILFLLPIMVTSNVSSRVYLKDWKGELAEEFSLVPNSSNAYPTSHFTRDWLYLVDTRTGEKVLPFLADYRQKNNELYHYWLGVFIGFVYQSALLYHACLFAVEFYVVRFYGSYLFILILEHNQPLVQKFISEKEIQTEKLPEEDLP